MDNKKVLIVEDDADVRSVLSVALQKHGFSVAEAEDGLKGLKYLESERPDVMLIDVMMPRLDGFSFVKAVRYRQENRSIPVIFLTAKTDARSMIDGINVGAKFFLTKPFQISDVVAKLNKALDDRLRGK